MPISSVNAFTLGFSELRLGPSKTCFVGSSRNAKVSKYILLPKDGKVLPTRYVMAEMYLEQFHITYMIYQFVILIHYKCFSCCD